MDLRAEADAVEAREREATAEGDEEEVEEEEAEPDAEAEADDDGEGAAKKKPAKKKAAKKPAAPKAKKPAAKRTRTAKEVRRKAVWRVFDNASKVVEEFPFNQKAEAEALLARKIQEKEGKATFYLNLVKVEMEA
jgi:hypothetical protein